MIGILKRVNPSTWALLLIFLFGLLPLTYFRDGRLVFGGDHGLWILNPFGQIYNDLFVWNTRAIESYAPYFPLMIPALLILGFLQAIGIPPFAAEGLFLAIFFLGSGLAVYFLSISLFGSKRFWLNFSAAIFYMFNAYSLIQWSIPHFVTLAALAYYPFVLALFIRGLSSKSIFKNSVIFALGSLLFVTGNFMPSYMLITFFTLLLYFIFHFLFLTENREDKLSAVKFALLGGLFFFLVNSWWIIPLISLRQEGLGWFASSSMGTEWTVANYSKRTSFLHLLQLQGWPGWGTDTFGYDKSYVDSPFLIILSFLPVTVAILGLILASKVKSMVSSSRKKIFFFLLLLLFALFLNKGSHPPFGEANLWLYRHLPGFVIFRTGFVKLGVMLSLSLAFLFGFGMENLKEVLSRRKFLISLTLGLILILNFIANYPFFTGQNILSKESFNGSSPHHQIPNAYFEAVNWWNNKPGLFKILSLPGQGNWSVFNWGKDDLYIGMDIFSELSEKTLLVAHTSDNLLKDVAFKMFAKGNLNKLENILGMLNIRYLLLHNDSNPSIFGTLPPQEIQKELADYAKIPQETQFGELAFYKIPPNDFYPHIYIPEKEIYLMGLQGKVENYLTLENSNKINGFFFEENNLQLGNWVEKIQDVSLTTLPVNTSLQHSDYRPDVIEPFARFTPDSKFYWYVENKEKKLEEAVGQNLEELVRVKLLFANKRLGEIDKLAKAKKYKYIQPTVLRYQEKMDEVMRLLEKARADKKYVADLIILTRAYLERQDELLKVTVQEVALQYDVSTLVSKVLIEESSLVSRVLTNNQKLLRYLRELEVKEKNDYWLTYLENPDEAQIVYHFVLPRSGSYQFFLIDSQDGDRFYNFETLREGKIRKIGQDNTATIRKSIKAEEGWLSFGNEFLENGEYIFSINKPAVKNLVANQNWRGFEKDAVFVAAGDSLRFEAKERPSVIYSQIQTFSPGDFYTIEFDYQTERGIGPTFAVWQNFNKDIKDEYLLKTFSPDLILNQENGESYRQALNNNEGEIEYFDLPTDYGWQHFEKTLNIKDRTKSMFLSFVVKEDNKVIFKPSLSYIKNVKVEKNFANPLVINLSSGQLTNPPSVEFMKINATKYKVKITSAQEPFNLVFSESFHPGWKAYLQNLNEKDFEGQQVGEYFNGQVKEKSKSGEFISLKTFETWNKKALSEEKHLLINGYANAWKIDKTGDFEIILEFQPQRFFYLGIFLFLAGLLVILLLFIKRHV